MYQRQNSLEIPLSRKFYGEMPACGCGHVFFSISLPKRICKTFDNSLFVGYNIVATGSDSRGRMPKGSG